MASIIPPKTISEDHQSNISDDDYMDYFAEVEVEDFDAKAKENKVNQDIGRNKEGGVKKEEQEEGEFIRSEDESEDDDDDIPKSISYANEGKRGNVVDGVNNRRGDDDYDRKVFVGGISWETTGEHFVIHFQKYGRVVDAKIIRDRHTGMPRGFGFVTFEDSSVVQNVLKDIHMLDGQRVEVRQTHPRKSLLPKTKQIFVGGLPLSLTEGEFKEYFATFGKVVEQEIMIDYATGKSRGFGFITFDDEDIVEEILSLGIMHEINDKKIQLRKMMKKPWDNGGGNSSVGGNMYGNHRGGSGYRGGYGYQSRGRFGGRGTTNMHRMYGTGYNYNVPYDYDYDHGMSFGSVYGPVPMYGAYEAFLNMNGRHANRGSRGGDHHGGASYGNGNSSGNGSGSSTGTRGHTEERYKPY